MISNAPSANVDSNLSTTGLASSFVGIKSQSNSLTPQVGDNEGADVSLVGALVVAEYYNTEFCVFHKILLKYYLTSRLRCCIRW